MACGRTGKSVHGSLSSLLLYVCSGPTARRRKCDGVFNLRP
ncbi:hypothetical protein HSR121_1496 [Halapricum desulfuricans]|uniref:Uncharacterized protein n=1 Tax=Halapricum desulfuricans TaxID=2841257 RepID=A0A897N432_9EURY|nr:hypothetical protein HSR121_1496 [Halapricum desulfuricans]